MYEWECPRCGQELVALDEEAMRPSAAAHLREHAEEEAEEAAEGAAQAEAASAARLAAASAPARVITAQYGGRCATCEGAFSEGDPITQTPTGWSHQTCPEERPLGAVCTECFTEIARSGECLC